MSIEHPQGIAAVLLGILVFHGSIYVVIALNTGWRFGYWIAGASFGGFFLFISVFWLATALGPRGDEPRWIPVAADETDITEAQVDDRELTSFGSYPSGAWESAEDEDAPLFEENDALSSSLTACLSQDTETLPAGEAEVCEQAQSFLPATDDLPKVEGIPVVMVPAIEDIRFAEEDGTLLGQATITPLTRDPRLAEDPEEGVAVAEPFQIAAFRDPGSVRLPAIVYFIAAVLWFAFHLWGLNRAERRRLSPVAA